MQKHTIWHSWYADALADIHQAPVGIDYADLKLTVRRDAQVITSNADGTMRMEHVEQWPDFDRDAEITQEIPRETMWQVVSQAVAS